ncbi:Fic family protein [Mycoplasmopsis anatis]|uniref:Fic family protein n=1 Tax=Mycoplasmopsis anatis TaxID=171279 RepID=UPI001C4FE5C1|nr:Fic family protein [Mycoplasmopsis anatis]
MNKMYDYSGLLKLISNKNINKSDLVKTLNISSKTIAKISKNEKIAKSVIKKLCDYFCCNENEICRVISNNKILNILNEEMKSKIKGGSYHKLQILMTYNSNHIEGSTLNEEQTKLIYETRTLIGENSWNIDDIIETTNHFKAIDFCIQNAENDLTEEFIKTLHYLIKRATKAENTSWIKIGDYKTRPNIIGDRETSDPKNVQKDIKNLLKKYNSIKTITLEDIVDFHYKFEIIHPFQDGNGRVGRLIAFKECLKNNIVPFIIEDRKKYFYYHGLQEYENHKTYLIETCYDGQDTIKEWLKYFNIKY